MTGIVFGWALPHKTTPNVEGDYAPEKTEVSQLHIPDVHSQKNRKQKNPTLHGELQQVKIPSPENPEC